MGDLIDGLENAIRAHCSDAMRDHYKGDVDGLALRALVQDYVTWRARFPSARPRRVHESDAFAASELRDRYASGLTAIRRDIEAGTELEPYLSRRVWKAHGRDRLLGYHGIHHLHMEPAGSEHVLFIAFRPEHAYLIDIYAHESDGANWAERAILETLIRNWDGAGILFAAQDGTSLRAEFDDDARLELERAGVQLMVEIDGRVWSSTAGSAGGAPRVAVRIGMEVGEELRKLRAAGEAALVAELHAISAEKWSPAIHQGQYGYHAENANTFVPFGTLDPP